MAKDPMTSAADTLVRQADKAGENAARSSYDMSFQEFNLPTDPNELGRMYGGVADNLSSNLDIGGALQRSRDVGERSATAAAAAVFESRYQAEERSKTPVADLDAEIDRLNNQRWGILPAVLGRTDIIDYGKKMQIATRATQSLDSEIEKLTNSRKRILDAADARAKDKIEGLKAEAEILDRQATAAHNDLESRIDLYKEGRASFDDIVQAALQLKKLNDDKKSSGAGGNPFIGMGGDGAGGFSPGEIAAFGYFEKFGDFPVADSSKQQVKAGLTTRYAQWVQAGRPGSKVVVGEKTLPAGVSGPVQQETRDIADLFIAPAASRQSGVLGVLGGSLPAGGASGSSSSAGYLPEPDGGEATDYYQR